ncbi:hypothetical protein [Modestobacter sp. SYSU DS0657]
MTAPEQFTDWTEVERRGRRNDALGVLGLVAFILALFALTGGLGVVNGAAAWWALAGYVALLAAILILQRTVPRMRRTAVDGRRPEPMIERELAPTGPLAWICRTVTGHLELVLRRDLRAAGAADGGTNPHY